MKKIVILGGGYGGMKCISALLKNKDKDLFHITLVDRLSSHNLKTEFFAVAAGSLSAEKTQIPFPNHPSVHFVQAEIENIDVKNKKIRFTTQAQMEYDYLVIALGCEDSYHGIEGAKEHTLSIQTPKGVQEAKERIQQLTKPSNILVIGGGLTGIELSSEIQQHHPKHQVHILEHGKTILAPFSPRIQTYATKWFSKKGVNITYQTYIQKIENEKVSFNVGQIITGKLIFWAGGIQINEVVAQAGLPLERGKVRVDAYQRAVGHEDVFVIGDCSFSELPSSAQLAEQHGINVGKTLISLLKGNALPKIKAPTSKGMLGSLGKYKGFGTLGPLSLTGVLPRVLKYGVNLYYKISIRK